ncbi:MAG: hypothetical protein P4M04_07305 [Acidobacteriota bacterium]|nr:hypothetical protein [Acidobacteriota bacterium]
MQRLSLCLRLLSVVLVFPVILIYIALLTVVCLLNSSSARSRTPLRLWVSVMDWVKGIPVGYSYWEQFEAPSMVDEIAVHHDD